MEGFGIIVVLFDVAVDGGLEVNDRVEDAAFEAPAGERGEEALDGVDPGGRCRGEMKGPARMAGEPGQHLGMFVGGVVVGDGVDRLSAGTARSIALRKRMNS